MSKRVLFTCTLLMMIGVAGFLDMANAFSRGTKAWNILALYLPASIALFLAIPGARVLATIVFVISYIFLGLLLVGSALSSHVVGLQLFGGHFPLQATFPLVFVAVALLGSVLALLHWSIFSPPFEEHLT